MLTSSLLLCCGSDSPEPGVDAGMPDAPEPDAGPTRVQCGDATLVISHRPFALALERTGSVVLDPPAVAPALELATIAAPRPEEFFDPRGNDDVAWSAAGDVLSVDPAEGNGPAVVHVGADVADEVAVEVSCVEDGHLRVDARPVAPVDVVLTRISFATNQADRYHGLGEQFSGVDSRGEVRAMQLHIDPASESGLNEVHVPVPFVVSPRGWGMFVESRRAGAFDVGATDPEVLSGTFDEPGLTLHLWAGPPLEVVAAYTRTTGLPKLPPDWAFGAQFWRNENGSGDEVLEDAARFRELDIPTSVIWIDNPWQTSYNDFTFQPERFPDPEGLITALQDQGFRVLLWSTPYLDAVESGADPQNPAEELFLQARGRDLFATDSQGGVYVLPWGGGDASGLPDFTNPDAVDFWQELIGRVTSMGIDGFKLDYGEEVIVDVLGFRPQIHFSNGETEATMHGVYSNLYHRTYEEALAADRGEGFVIGRATVWGGQSDVDCVWPGDLDANFARHVAGDVGGLPAAVAGMQSLAASGFPVFGSDTGGYREGTPDKETLLRWAGHTAFSPLLQLGGGGPSHAPWNYDEEAVDAYRAFARWHVDLFPTLHALVTAASRQGTPVVRSMALAFPDDPDALDRGDQYMLGPDVLVAPLVEGGTARSVYLPAGRWLDLFNSEVVEGPTVMVRDTPLDEVPAYLRAGGILVLGSPDVDTLADAEAEGIVDARDRADVRRVLAFGDAAGASVTDSPSVSISSEGGEMVVSSSSPGGVESLLFELRLPGASTAAAEGEGLVEAATPADVSAGCGCFAFDRTKDALLVGTSGEARFTIGR
ncbi:MAG: glycoside hydrolase family 31 protein [Deltaproteobacteria bacterium]|nr:glycoside hydrolase family 31 protein [Deltaproteobacteria bacterium]